MDRLISPPFGSLHPVIPRTMPLVLDLNSSQTLVQLQDQVEGRIKKITLTDWRVEMDGDEYGPYFQVKFSQGIEVRTLSWGGSIIPNSIQVPWRGRSKEVPVIRELMGSRVFLLELFDSEGSPLNPIRCVLWFLIELE